MKIVYISAFLLIYSFTVFGQKELPNQVIKVLKKDIVAQAHWAMTQKPVFRR